MVSVKSSDWERSMDTIVSEIAKTRMIKDVNEALTAYGLFVSSIEFDATNDFSVVIKLCAYDLKQFDQPECFAKNIAVPEGTAC